MTEFIYLNCFQPRLYSFVSSHSSAQSKTAIPHRGILMVLRLEDQLQSSIRCTFEKILNFQWVCTLCHLSSCMGLQLRLNRVPDYIVFKCASSFSSRLLLSQWVILASSNLYSIVSWQLSLLIKPKLFSERMYPILIKPKLDLKPSIPRCLISAMVFLRIVFRILFELQQFNATPQYDQNRHSLYYHSVVARLQ